jgi:hypothetical protein
MVMKNSIEYKRRIIQKQREMKRVIRREKREWENKESKLCRRRLIRTVKCFLGKFTK